MDGNQKGTETDKMLLMISLMPYESRGNYSFHPK